MVRTSARGYASFTSIQARFESDRRVPSAPWFALCGSIGQQGDGFQISLDTSQLMAGSGDLGLFANDVAKAYWNNSGGIEVEIARVR